MMFRGDDLSIGGESNVVLDDLFLFFFFEEKGEELSVIRMAIR